MLSFAIYVTALTALAHAEEMRVIDFGNRTATLSISQVDALIKPGQAGVGFMDITDHRNQTQQAMAPVCVRGSKAHLASKTFCASIPDKVMHQELVDGFNAGLKPKAVETTVTHLSSYFTRYYTTNTAVQAVNWLKAEYEKAAAGRTDVSIQIFEHTWAQPSLIVTVAGSGNNRGETVILGGHMDSTAGGATRASPGADDDGSGSAAVLEVFRILMENRFVPDRTVEFHAYAAEEAGLRGSAAISQEYSNIGRNVVSMVQFDMLGWPMDITTPIGLTEDYVSPELSAFVGTLTTTYSALTWEASVCGYACSDHASWYKVGVPSSFPFESKFGTHNPNIHTANDVNARMSFPRCNEFVKMGVGYVVELADPVN